MRSLLEKILEPGGLSVVFQPIFKFHNGLCTLHSLEGLTRGPRGTSVESADALFEYVRRKGKESLVERACVALVLGEAPAIPDNTYLSINLHAATLARDSRFCSFIKAAALVNSIPPARLIVEIVEHAPYWRGQSFIRSVETLREMGVKIALDDIGKGQSNYSMLIDCRPGFIKVDRYVVNQVSSDEYRRAILESVVQLAEKVGARVVAEGIESHSDLDAVLDTGIEFVQGYLLSMPQLPSQLDHAISRVCSMAPRSRFTESYSRKDLILCKQG